MTVVPPFNAVRRTIVDIIVSQGILPPQEAKDVIRQGRVFINKIRYFNPLKLGIYLIVCFCG